MKFNCYYRAKDGSRQSVEIDAVDRHSAFLQAKKDKLIVIELLEDSVTSIKDYSKTQKTLARSTSKSTMKKTVDSKKPTIKKTIDPEMIVFKQRAHSYTMGYLFSIFGFILAALIWKNRGVKYAFYGVAMGFLTFILGWIADFPGLVFGIVIALVVDAMIIPRPKQKTNWEDL